MTVGQHGYDHTAVSSRQSGGDEQLEVLVDVKLMTHCHIVSTRNVHTAATGGGGLEDTKSSSLAPGLQIPVVFTRALTRPATNPDKCRPSLSLSIMTVVQGRIRIVLRLADVFPPSYLGRNVKVESLKHNHPGEHLNNHIFLSLELMVVFSLVRLSTRSRLGRQYYFLSPPYWFSDTLVQLAEPQ